MILLAWLVAWDLAATLVVISPAPGPALLGLLCLDLLAFLLARRRRHSPTATGDDQHRSDDDEAPPRPPAPPTTRRLRLPDHDRTGDDGAATARHTHIYDNGRVHPRAHGTMGAEQFAPLPMPAPLNFVDFGAATNATLSAPDRRDSADCKAAAIPAWSVGYRNRLGREKGCAGRSVYPA